MYPPLNNGTGVTPTSGELGILHIYSNIIFIKCKCFCKLFFGGAKLSARGDQIPSASASFSLVLNPKETAAGSPFLNAITVGIAETP